MNKERLEELEILFKTNTQIPSNLLWEEILNYMADRKTPIKFKTDALLFLRKHKSNFDPMILAKVLHIRLETAQSLIENEIIQSSFPIASKDNSKLLTAYTIKIENSNSFSFFKNINNTLKTIEFLTQCPFFVTFDEEFEGNSFMLALYAAIVAKYKKLLNSYAFTGSIDFGGNIIESDYIKEKETASCSVGKILISGQTIYNIEELAYILNSDKVDIPFCISTKSNNIQKTPKEAALSNLNKITRQIEGSFGVRFEAIKKLYNLKDQDFMYYTQERFLPDNRWDNFLLEAYSKIQSLKAKIPEKIAVLHISLLTSSAFSFCLGSMIGCREPFIAYHYKSGKYHQVLNCRSKNPRVLKEIPKKTSHIQCKYSTQSDSTLAIIFHLASHNPAGDVEMFLEENYKDYAIMKCALVDKQGNIPLKNWKAYIREMYKHYNDTKNSKIKKRLFFFSAPVVLAFGLGAVIETFEDIDVFNLKSKDNSYTKVANLKNLHNS
jgi:hypothetical protein